MKTRLGINIDQVATVRNARGGIHPDPLKIALLAEKAGADLIVAHLREDRRHVNEGDVISLINKIRIPLQLEIALTEEMIEFVMLNKPDRICIVPEKRQEITTEGGIDLFKNTLYIKEKINLFKKNNIKFSFFIDPVIEQIKKAKDIGINAIELHTGSFANAKKNDPSNFLQELISAAKEAKKLGLQVHAGHGLNFETIEKILVIKEIEELNIGHFIIGESIFIGIEEVIKKILNIINKVY